MKNRSVKSLPISVTDILKTVNDRVSAVRSPHLLSRAGKGIPAVLGNLRPRFFEGLAAPELKSILAAAELPEAPVKFRDYPPRSTCQASIFVADWPRQIFLCDRKRTEGHPSLDSPG